MIAEMQKMTYGNFKNKIMLNLVSGAILLSRNEANNKTENIVRSLDQVGKTEKHHWKIKFNFI